MPNSSQRNICLGPDKTKRLTILFIALVAAGLLPAMAAACPQGYVSCGERNQLCCPAKP